MNSRYNLNVLIQYILYIYTISLEVLLAVSPPRRAAPHGPPMFFRCKSWHTLGTRLDENWIGLNWIKKLVGGGVRKLSVRVFKRAVLYKFCSSHLFLQSKLQIYSYQANENIT